VPTTFTSSSSEDGSSDSASNNAVVIVGIVAGTVVILGLFVLIYCLFKSRMQAADVVINESHIEKGSSNDETIDKNKSNGIIMSDDVFFGDKSYVETVPSPKKQQRNRRVRTRQVLEIREFD
jgi:hypothetical protein